MAARVAELEILLTANTGQASAQLNSFANSFHRIIGGGILSSFGKKMLDMAKDFVVSGAEFEQTMLRIDRLAGNAGENVDALTRKAYQVDQATIFSAQQVAESMEQLAREGFSAEQIFNGFVDAAVNFAAVIDEDVVRGANIFGNVMRIFKSENLEAAEAADILSSAILRSGRPAAEFATGMQYLGSIASQLGVPLLDASTALSFLTANGIKARSAGTGLRTMFLELASGGEKLAEVGIQAFDPQTGAFVGMRSVIDQFHELMATMTDEEAISFLEDFFGKSAATPLLTLFRGGAEAYDEHQKKMLALGSAASFMAALMDTTAGSIDRFSAAFSNFGRSLGTAAGPLIRPVLDFLTALLSAFVALPTPVHTATIALIGVVGALAALTGAIMVFQALGGLALLTAALGTMATVGAVVAAVAAVIAVGVLAWKTNFLGFRDAVTGVVDFVVGKLTTAKDFLGDFFDYISKFNNDKWMADGFWLDPMPQRFGLTRFPQEARRTVHALASITESVKDLWAGFREGGAEGLRRRLPGELRQMQTAFGALREELVGILPDHLRDIAYNLGTIGEAAMDVAIAFAEGGLDRALEVLPGEMQQAVNALGRIGVTVAEVAVSVGGWVIETTEDLWTAITRKVYELFGGDASAYNGQSFAGFDPARGQTGVVENAIPLGVIAVQITDWTVSALTPLWNALTRKVYEWFGGEIAVGDATGGGFPIASGEGIPLGVIQVQITAWSVTAAENLWDAIKAKVYGWFGGTTEIPEGLGAGGVMATGVSGGIPIGVVAVQITDWLVTSSMALWDAVKEQVYAWFGGFQEQTGPVPGSGIPLGTVALQILDWSVTSAKPISDAVIDFITPIAEVATGKVYDLGTIALSAAVEATNELGSLLNNGRGWLQNKLNAHPITGPISLVSAVMIQAKVTAAGELMSVLSNFGGWLKNKINGIGTPGVPGGGGGLGKAVDIGTVTLKATFSFLKQDVKSASEQSWYQGFVDAIKEGFSKAADVIGQTPEALAGVRDSILGLISEAFTAIGDISPDDIGTTLGNLATSVASAFATIINGAGDLLLAGGSATSQAGASLENALLKFLSSGFSAIADLDGSDFFDIGVAVGAAIQTVLEQTVTLLESGVKGYASLVTNIGKAWLGVFKFVFESAASFVKTAKAGDIDVSGFVGGFVDLIGSAISTATDGLKPENLLTAGDALLSLPGKMVAFFAGIFSGLLLGEDAAADIASIKEAVTGFFGRIFDSVLSFDLAEGQGEAHAGGPGSWVYDKLVTPLIDAITDGFKDLANIETPELPEWMTSYEWLTDPIQGLIDEINAKVEDLKKAWQDLQFWKNQTTTERGDVHGGGTGKENAPPLPHGEGPPIPANLNEFLTSGIDLGPLQEALGGKGAVFTSTFDADNSLVVSRFQGSMDLGNQWAGSVFTSMFDVDNALVVSRFQGSLQLGGTWEASVFTATFDVDNALVVSRFQGSMQLGATWDAAYFAATFDADNSLVVSRYLGAVELGNLWAGQTFTATFNAVSTGLAGVATIPTFATGGTFGGPGDAFIAGEDGPELVVGARKGTRIFNASDTRRMFSAADSAPTTINHRTENYYFAVTGDDLARLQRDAEAGKLNIRRAARELDLSFA